MKNGYELSRGWFNFAFENIDKVTANHTALYLWLCEINNRCGWVEKFQITRKECMDGMSCKSYNTYNKCLNDLIEWQFVILVKKSINQYQCNVIALSKIDKAQYKALDKALYKAQGESTIQSTDTILKQQTIKQQTINIEFDIFWSLYDKKKGDKADCIKKWNKLKDEEREKIIHTLPDFLKQITDKKFQPMPATYLNQKRWEDELITKNPETTYIPTQNNSW